jgi:hypothetical protein
MIAAVTYNCQGNDRFVGGVCSVYIQAESGYTFLDVIYNGLSVKPADNVVLDNETGKITFPHALNRGDIILSLFRQLPRLLQTDVGGFTEFVNGEFVIGEFL